MTKSFMRVTTENFGVLHFSACGNFHFALTDEGVFLAKDFVTVENSNGDFILTVKHSYGGVLLSTTRKLRVKQIDEVKCYYKRSAVEVPEAFGGFHFGKRTYRTISEVTSEVPACSECEVQSEALVGLS
jgi:hypothetical protein